MMSARERASIFSRDARDDALAKDVGSFHPKSEKEERPDRKAIRAVSEENDFPSRQTSKATRPRRYRTGRNVQINIKARKETVEAIYRIADNQGWVLGETLERAIEALENSLAKRKGKN